MERATTISAIAQALSPQPLIDTADFNRFYSERFESPEADTTKILQLELSRAYRGLYYRRFLTGHRGVGKSTELTRLASGLADRFEFIRLSVQEEMSPSSTQPFDLLNVMAVKLVERCGDLRMELAPTLLEKVQRWFEEVTERRVSAISTGLAAEAEAGSRLPSLFNVLRLGAVLRGEARYSSARTEEAVQKKLQQLSDLRDRANDLFRESNAALQSCRGKEWVFLVEDLDKIGVAEKVLKTLFVDHANVWSDLQVHFICTIPLWLAFGPEGAALPFRRRAIVDIPVFDRKHAPYEPGRRILRGILDKRLEPGLFADGVREQLIQAGGGNLRDMFFLVGEAANFAEILGRPQIEAPQGSRAINALRNEYLQRLGETSPQDHIPYKEKVAVLQTIYKQTEGQIVQDPVLHRLLRSRVVHEYNETYWCGLPPLIVDILLQQGHLKEGSKGGLEPYST